MSTLVEAHGGPKDGTQLLRPDSRPMPWEMIFPAARLVMPMHVHVYHSPAPGTPYEYKGTREWQRDVDYFDGQPIGGFTSRADTKEPKQ